MKINFTEFTKLLSPYTRGYLDAKQWREVLKIFQNVLIEQLSKGNTVHLPFGKFYTAPNSKQTISNAINGDKNIPIKNKYQVRCSCPDQFKEKVNAGKK